MKRVVTRLVFVFLFCFFIPIDAFAQSTESTKGYDCNERPLGLFRQVTNSRLELIDGFKETYKVVEESEIKEKQRKPSAFDEVDPAYYIYLIRNPSESMKKSCEAEMPVAGEFIAPNGKLFEFARATYSIAQQRLTFTTVERYGIIHQLEARVPAGSKVLTAAKLTTTIKGFGTVIAELSFEPWNFH